MSILQVVLVSNVLSLLVSPNPVNAATPRGNTLNVNVTGTPSQSGGTYLWSWVSGGVDINIVNSASQTCTLSSTTTVGALPILRTGVLRCTYTLGALVKVQDVNVTFSFEVL